jgi:hypothetical protein
MDETEKTILRTFEQLPNRFGVIRLEAIDEVGACMAFDTSRPVDCDTKHFAFFGEHPGLRLRFKMHVSKQIVAINIFDRYKDKSVVFVFDRKNAYRPMHRLKFSTFEIDLQGVTAERILPNFHAWIYRTSPDMGAEKLASIEHRLNLVLKPKIMREHKKPIASAIIDEFNKSLVEDGLDYQVDYSEILSPNQTAKDLSKTVDFLLEMFERGMPEQVAPKKWWQRRDEQ